MKGFRVSHPRFGKGLVVDTRHKGKEFLVEFDKGFRLWIVRKELKFLNHLELVNRPTTGLSPLPEISPLRPRQNQGREVIEAFRMGIVPLAWTKYWTVGRSYEMARIKTWLYDQTSGTMIIKGEYGSGKTHLIEYLYALALELNYAVAKVSIDPVSAHMAFPKRIYRQLVQTFRVAYHNKCLNFREALLEMAKANVLETHTVWGPFLKSLNQKKVSLEMWHWIEGWESNFRKWGALYDHTTAANIYCYLLSGLSHGLVDALDVNGLILLFDEAESARIYRYNYEWLRGINLFKALIMIANDEPDLLEERVIKEEDGYKGELSGLVYSGHRQWPYVYEIPTYLKVVFAVTPDVALENLVTNYNIYCLELEPLGVSELEYFFFRFVELYSEVYGLQLSRQEKRQIFSIIQPYAFFSTRMFIKAMVEVLDFKRFFPQKPLAILR